MEFSDLPRCWWELPCVYPWHMWRLELGFPWNLPIRRDRLYTWAT